MATDPQAIPRADGRVKVTGLARYCSDVPVANPAFARLVTSAVALGSIRRLYLDDARAVPGVLDILTYENANVVKKLDLFSKGGQAGTSIVPLSSRKIWHDGQIVAVVVAETLEAAIEAAGKVGVEYDEQKPTATFGSPGATVKSAAEGDESHKDPSLGDAESAFAAAPVRVDAEYATPTQHHNPMELFTTTCLWDDDKLTIYEPSQFVYGFKNGVAHQLGIDPEDVRVVSPFVGGAFGSRGSLTQRTALAAVAARRVGRPVKLAASRAQGFTIATYRAETRHRVRLGAGTDGRILAYLHDAEELTSRPDDYSVSGTSATAILYDYGSVATKVNLVKADRNTPGFMRAPPEVPYMFALESAMDELAAALDMDPVELRRRNDTMKDPIDGRPYSSRSLVQCFDAAAEAFGWRSRSAAPGSMRDGDWLVGFGCATAWYPTQIAAAAVRVRLAADGAVRVAIAAHEIGTGAMTVIGQAAAERLGLRPDQVTVLLGDSALPAGPVAGGSNTTASATTVVVQACEKIRARLIAAASAEGAPLAGLPTSDFILADGRIAAGNQSAPIGDVLRHAGVGAIEEYAESVPRGLPKGAIDKLYDGHATLIGGHKGAKVAFAFGAQFVEARVHALTREVRVPRAVGAFAAGRIMNPRTAKSQLMGGMIWGIGSALHEATELDERTARYVNTNLADYLIPVNADIASIDVILVPERDDWVNPLGVKGVGELGIVGLNAAVANAVWHATGVRIRELPIRLEKLIT